MSTQEHQTPPLPVGLTLDRGFALLRRHPRALLLPQLVLNILPLVLALVLTLVGYVVIGDVDTTRELVRNSTAFGDSTLEYQDVPDFTSGQITLIVVLAIPTVIAYFWFVIAAAVSIVLGADRALEGRDHVLLRPAMREALRKTPKLFGLYLVFAILAIVALVLGGIVVAIVAAVAGALAVLPGIALFLAIFWAGTRFSLWPVVHLSEGIGFGSFGRAFRLTKGRFWQLFGVLILTFLIVGVVSTVLSLLMSAVVSVVASADDTAGVVAFIPYLISSALLNVVFTAALVAPFVVAYRTLSGRDNADLWQAAGAMGAAPAAAAPPADPSVRRWDASEEPIGGAAPASSSDADAPPARGTGLGGLPDPSTRSDAEERWGRDSGEPPRR